MELRKCYPHTYDFLLLHKGTGKRDKGNEKYPAWYAYGPIQGMNNFGKKLLIPYISSTPTAVISLHEYLLFESGRAKRKPTHERISVSGIPEGS